MIRFVDLNTGHVFNGSVPYIHWFDDQQSTKLIYVKKICVVTDAEEAVIKLHCGEVFHLLQIPTDVTEDQTINDFKYKDIKDLYVDEYVSEGYLYSESEDELYIHMIYIAGSSEYEGEFIEDLFINNNRFQIGSAFYDEYEPHKINLANFGSEIPESFVRAIYSTNVHEEMNDYATINRKRKELLLEYWNIIAQKGNYKSLYDALAWFEYGNLVTLKEFWKHHEWTQDRLNHQPLNSLLDSEVKNSLANYAKTTYLGLYLALQEMLTNEEGQVQYEFSQSTDQSGELVPALKEVAINWSKEDLSLKMFLLGNYYERYLMPIHLDLLHSTIEDIVFANTIKIPTNTHLGRWDWIHNTQDFYCSVKNGDVFRLQDVQVQVGPDTMFGNLYNVDGEDDYSDIDPFGVESEVEQIMADDDDQDTEGNLRTFMSQLYSGVGVMIPFYIKLPLDEGDFVNRESISVICDKHNIWEYKEFHKILGNEFRFNLLCTQDRDYDITLQFNTAGGRTFTKTISFEVIDKYGHSMYLYKVKSGEPTDDQLGVNDYVFGHQRRLLAEGGDASSFYYKQFIPAVKNSTGGVQLNHILVYEGDVNYAEDECEEGDNPFVRLVFLRNNYILTYRYKLDNNYEETDEVLYTIAVSKEFWFEPNEDQLDFVNTTSDESIRLIRNEHVYFPMNHHLEEVNGTTLDSFTITDEDAVCIVPDIDYSKIVNPEWIFVNMSTGKNIKLPSIREPFVANTEKTSRKSFLTPGYYTIIFRYRLSGNPAEVQEITLDSCFRKV